MWRFEAALTEGESALAARRGAQRAHANMANAVAEAAAFAQLAVRSGRSGHAALASCVIGSTSAGRATGAAPWAP